MTDIFIALSRNAVTDCAAPAVPCDITLNTVNLGRCYNACVTVSALPEKTVRRDTATDGPEPSFRSKFCPATYQNQLHYSGPTENSSP